MTQPWQQNIYEYIWIYIYIYICILNSHYHMTQRRYTLTYTLAITSVVGPTVLSWCFTPGLITGPSMPAIGKKKGAPLAEPYPQTKPTINLQLWNVGKPISNNKPPIGSKPRSTNQQKIGRLNMGPPISGNKFIGGFSFTFGSSQSASGVSLVVGWSSKYCGKLNQFFEVKHTILQWNSARHYVSWQCIFRNQYRIF